MGLSILSNVEANLFARPEILRALSPPLRAKLENEIYGKRNIKTRWQTRTEKDKDRIKNGRC